MARMTTGELRSLVQPVVFLHLLGPAKIADKDGEFAFGEGTLVAAQYWGAGLISLTAMNGEKHMVIAHDINASLVSNFAALSE